MDYDEMLGEICDELQLSWWEIVDSMDLDDQMASRGADIQSESYQEWAYSICQDL